MNYLFVILSSILLFSGCSVTGLQMDADGDKVADIKDLCKNTPLSAKVDMYGCALDNDKDGVIDIYDKCANTSIFEIVNQDGCTLK